MANWFECKVRYDKTLENGLIKKVTFIFTLVVNVALHFKLKKLNMVESLKSIE